MADEQDPFADLGTQDPFADAVPKANVRIMAYGPVVGEHHHAAMFGPQGNKLEPYDVAASPNLGLKLGEWIEVNGKARRVGDWSYLSPGVPTKDTIEIRDAKDQGRGTINRISLSPEEIQKRISEYPQIAGERTAGSERAAAQPAEVKGDPFADLIPEKKATGADPFSDMGTPTPSARGFKGTEPGQAIPEPTPVATPDLGTIDLTPTPEPTPQRRAPIVSAPTAPSPVPTLTPVRPQQPFAIPTSGQQPPPPIAVPSALQDAAEQDPSLMQKAARAAGRYVTDMIPRSVEQAVQMTGIPTDLTDPFQDLGLMLPGIKSGMDIGRQAYHRMQQIQEAENTPPYSQQRFDAGIGTALDLLGMAGVAGGVKAGMRPRPPSRGLRAVASTREVPVPETFQPRNETVRSASIRINGKQFEGVDHADAVAEYAKSKGISQDQAWADVTSPTADVESGFTTDSGRFVDSEEASAIAKSKGSHAAEIIKRPAPQLSEPFDVTLEDGRKFGVQTVSDQTVIYGEHEALNAPSVSGVKTTVTPKWIAGRKGKTEWLDAPNGTYRLLRQTGNRSGKVLLHFRENNATEWNKIGEFNSTDSAKLAAENHSNPTPPTEPPPPAATPPPAPPTQPQLPLPPEAPQPNEALNPVRGSGKFIRSYRIDKELGDRMEGIGAARESGALRAETESRNLLDGLTPAQEVDLGRYLVSRRLETVNPDHPQIISALESIRIERDPSIAKALEYYKSNIKPEIEAFRKRAGLSEEAAAGKAPEFISLIPKTMDLLPQQTAAGTFINPAKLPRTTIFARAAQGLAREYNVNLRDILTESYGESIRKARTREFYDAAVRKGIVNKTDVRMPDGNFAKVAQFDDLPPELQHDLTEATKANLAPVGLQKVGQIYQRVVTGAALTANPAELVNHMRRQLNLVAAKPPIGSGLLARLEALVPYFGPKLGAFKRTIGDNMSSPENQAILKDIFDAGGGSTRSFAELYGAHPKRPFAQKLARYSGYEWLQAKTQKLLFGVPKGYGIQGWDLRMRVQLEKIRRVAEGNVDPQRIREFANQIGQYGRHNSWAVEALRKINPYAATTLPMRLTELNTAIGNTGLKEGLSARTLLHRGETLARGTGGSILVLTTANYLLSGKWPWENDKGHEFDLNTGVTNKNGQSVYVKLRAIAPELSRPVSTVSLSEMSRETTARHPQYTSAALTGPLNQAASLVSGPGQNFALTALSGKVPYFLKRPGEGPELMDVAMLRKGERGQSRGLKQLRAAAANVNPFGDIFGPNFNVEVPGGMSYIEEPVHGVKPFGRIFSTSYEKKHGSGMAPPAIPPPPQVR